MHQKIFCAMVKVSHQSDIHLIFSGLYDAIYYFFRISTGNKSNTLNMSLVNLGNYILHLSFVTRMRIRRKTEEQK